MLIRIRTIAQTNTPPTEQLVEVPVLRIGRGTDQDLVLGDIRVALAHAEISPHKGFLGTNYRIESKTRLGVWVNGAPTGGADLSSGDVLDFGSYQIKVEKSSGGVDLTLSIQQSLAATEERAGKIKKLKTRIQDTGWSRRRLAWLLFFVVVLPALAWPVFSHLSNLQQRNPSGETRDYIAPISAEPDIQWLSGPMSNAHHMLAKDCAACHKQPFEQVKDSSCLGCHDSLKDHAKTLNVQAQHPFAGLECTDCHREHNGGAGMVPVNNKNCTSCHADPQNLPGDALLPVKNWSSNHPEFNVHLSKKTDQGFKWIEARQGTAEASKEDVGIKYPHDIHVSKDGIDAPGKRKVLECSYCHTKAEDGVRFKPIQMSVHCAECHKLDFDPNAPDRELPHGKPAEIVKVVKDYYARVALAGGVKDKNAPAFLSERRIPGQVMSPATAKAALSWADARAGIALKDVFERRTCFYCHTVTKQPLDTEVPWKIAPVAPENPAITGSVFPHSQHETASCASCHTAEKSKHSEDVLLPDIKRCRDCHGDTDSMHETPSPCQSCHAYHEHPLKAEIKERPAPALKAQPKLVMGSADADFFRVAKP